MKKISVLSLVAALCVMFVACGGNSKGASEAPATVSVDEVLANADSLLGDTIIVEGVCSHLCAHGGKKAFVAGSADSLMLRCEAYPIMGEPFSKDAIRRPVKVKGILCEERVDEAVLQEMIRKNNELMAAAEETGASTDSVATHAEGGCSTERAAKGQRELTSFEERINDFRNKIATRQAKEGKDYLSFYYLQAAGYEILPE